MTMEEILGQEWATPIEVSTVNMRLKRVGIVLNCAKVLGESKWEIGPHVGLLDPVDDDTREQFSDNDLCKIFGHDDYKLGKHDTPSKYWVPFMALYSGGRRNEVCQLHLEDIKEVDGVWCIHFTEKHETPL